MKPNNVLQTVKIISLALILGLGLSYASAWTGPTVAPPGSNTSSPVDISGTAQIKTGGLWLGSLGTDGGAVIGTTISSPQYCIGASCISAWPTSGASLWSESGNDIYYNSGNVGIGTTSPGMKLDVYTNSDVYGIRTGDSANSNLRISGTACGATGYGLIQTFTGGTSAGGSLVFQRDGGNVGIGTASPDAKLDVNGQIIGGFGAMTTGGVLDWNDVSNTRSGSGYTLLQGTATNGPGAGTYYHAFNLEYSSKDGSGNVTQLAIPYGSPGGGGDIYMRGRYSGVWTGWGQVSSQWTNAGSSIYYASGNVGIGTVSPGQKLDVMGNIYASGDIRVGGPIYRMAAGAGYLNGQYSTYENSGTSGAIYSIGGSYVPTATTLGNMYGIGYTIGSTAGSPWPGSWGLYVASGGVPRIFLDSDGGIAFATTGFRVNGSGYTIQDSNQFYCNNASACYFNWSGTGATNVGNAAGVYIPGKVGIGGTDTTYSLNIVSVGGATRGIHSTASAYGIIGSSAAGTGVWGEGGATGVYATGATGVYATSCTGCSVLAEMAPVAETPVNGDVMCTNPDTGKTEVCRKDKSRYLKGIAQQKAEQIMRMGCAKTLDATNGSNAVSLGIMDINAWKKAPECAGWYPIALSGLSEETNVVCKSPGGKALGYGDILVTSKVPGMLRPLDEDEDALSYQIAGKADSICSTGKETDSIKVWIQ